MWSQGVTLYNHEHLRYNPRTKRPEILRIKEEIGWEKKRKWGEREEIQEPQTGKDKQLADAGASPEEEARPEKAEEKAAMEKAAKAAKVAQDQAAKAKAASPKGKGKGVADS